MGCGSSSEAGPSQVSRPADPAEDARSAGIDKVLGSAKRQDELKVKLLLLGAGESGKSTIFKQMRILYGSPRSEDDLRMYGVVVRSNVITAMKKMCLLLRKLGLEDQLLEEPAGESQDMAPHEAFQFLTSHLVDHTAAPLEKANGVTNDWVGHSARAGLGPNNDAQQFLQLWKPMKVLWEVSERFNASSWLLRRRTSKITSISSQKR